ncbi:MAG: FixH family protein [Saprospiraceae bacterium]
MKLNWGTGIAIFYISFMAIMIFMVMKTTTYDNSLVVDNYYEKDLQYQSHFEKKANNQDLAQKVVFDFSAVEKTIDLQFPKTLNSISGSVRLYNPISKFGDVDKLVKVDSNNTMSIPLDKLKPGRWKVLLDWKDSQKAYYTETEFVL